MRQNTHKLFQLFLLVFPSLLLWQCKTTKREEVVTSPTISYPKITLKTDYLATTQTTAVLDVTKTGQETNYSIEFIYSLNADLSLSAKILAGFGKKEFMEGESLPFRITGLRPNNTHYVRGILTLPDTVIKTDIVEFKTLATNTLGRFRPMNDPRVNFGNNHQIAFEANNKGFVLSGDLSSKVVYLWDYDPISGVWNRKKENKNTVLTNAFFDNNNFNQVVAVDGQHYLAMSTPTGWCFYSINLGTGGIEEHSTIEVVGARLCVANNKLFAVGLSAIAGNAANKLLQVSELSLATNNVVKTTQTTTANYSSVIMAQMADNQVNIILNNLTNTAQAIHQFNPVTNSLSAATDISDKLPQTNILHTFEANNNIYYFSSPTNNHTTHYLSVFNPRNFFSTRLTEYAGSESSNVFKINNIFHIIHSSNESYMLEVDF